MASMDGVSRTILVVEDERIVAKDLQQLLTGFGYRVPATAATSDDAIRIASESCPDLVLMDIRIKGERDGIETAAILRRDFDIPVVYLSAYADDATVARAKATSPHGYLIKPVKPEELRSTLEIALHRHEMDRRLREREHFYSTTLRSMGDAVIATDPNGSITFMNEIAEQLVARRAEHVIGTDVDDLIRTVDPGTVDGTATPIVDRDGKVLGVVRVFRDITTQTEVQQQLVLADRMSSLGTMAAGVADEINNPLAVIVANGALAAQELDDLDRDASTLSPAELRARMADLRAMLSDVCQSADRATKIVGDLRTFSRPQEDGPRPVEVADAIEWALRVAEHQMKGRARLIRELAPVPPVLAAEARLGQVFANLLANLAGSLDERRAGNELRIATRHEGDRVVVELSHNGTTPDPEIRARLFEPFFRGTGLELAVSHGIVKAMGGTIAVEAGYAGGTLFRIELPAAGRPTVADAALATPRGQIVLVDDEPLLLSSLTRVLSREHEVHAFSNPHAALELVTRRTDLDLVLCDLIMPGLTGIDIYERVLEVAPSSASKFVFVTGGAFTTRGKEFLASVSNPCLEKPFGPDRLRTFVREFLLKTRAAITA